MLAQKPNAKPKWHELIKLVKRFLAFCAMCNGQAPNDNYQRFLGCTRENLVQLRYVPQLYIISKGPHGLFRDALKNMGTTGIKSLNSQCEIIMKDWIKDKANVSCDYLSRLVSDRLLTSALHRLN